MTTTAHEDQFTPAPVEVTQADRDAAAEYVAENFSNQQAEQTRLGTAFVHLVQAFARHRIEAAEGADLDKLARGLTVRAYIAASCAGYAAFALAVGSGVPVWVDWPSWQVPADATDIGALVFVAMRLALKAHIERNEG